ncbi:uncharacterized protein LOC125738876 [Brienomyrus brachyistius]|uniref:uncharacterized protein LOC125738876 n=1 Tax=Brienomyrus brachyistius TaxID=42636 RepID=UPI0020B43344|nr:uncharacterized protein LOC125738876 [Brienomyrus brachyistius]
MVSWPSPAECRSRSTQRDPKSSGRHARTSPQTSLGMNSLDRRHRGGRTAKQGQMKYADGYMDETDREVSSLTDRAFRSLCVGEEGAYTDPELTSSPRDAFTVELPATFQYSIIDSQDQGLQYESQLSNGAIEATLQKRRSRSRVSSLVKAFSSSEGGSTMDGAPDGCRSDPDGWTWERSALLSLNNELSDFPAYCRDPFIPAASLQAFHLGPASASSKTLRNKASKATFRKLSSINYFLHSEHSPFQTWADYNRIPCEREATSSTLSPSGFHRWYDSPLYKELTASHRIQTTHSEDVKSYWMPSKDRTPSVPERSVVQPKPTAVEKRCESEVVAKCPPWRKSRNQLSNQLPVYRPCTASPCSHTSRRRDDASFSGSRPSAVHYQVHTLVGEQTAGSCTPFSISQLLTPVLNARQEMETSEVSQYELSPADDLAALRDAEPCPPPELKLRDSYKAMASSLLFNLKDNRKRVKSTYSPTKFKGLELSDSDNLPSRQDNAAIAMKKSGSGPPWPGISTNVQPGAAEACSVYSPALQPTKASAADHTKYTEANRLDDYFTLISPPTVKEAPHYSDSDRITQENTQQRDQLFASQQSQYRHAEHLPAASNEILSRNKSNQPARKEYKTSPTEQLSTGGPTGSTTVTYSVNERRNSFSVKEKDIIRRDELLHNKMDTTQSLAVFKKHDTGQEVQENRNSPNTDAFNLCENVNVRSTRSSLKPDELVWNKPSSQILQVQKWGGTTQGTHALKGKLEADTGSHTSTERQNTTQHLFPQNESEHSRIAMNEIKEKGHIRQGVLKIQANDPDSHGVPAHCQNLQDLCIGTMNRADDQTAKIPAKGLNELSSSGLYTVQNDEPGTKHAHSLKENKHISGDVLPKPKGLTEKTASQRNEELPDQGQESVRYSSNTESTSDNYSNYTQAKPRAGQHATGLKLPESNTTAAIEQGHMKNEHPSEDYCWAKHGGQMTNEDILNKAHPSVRKTRGEKTLAQNSIKAGTEYELSKGQGSDDTEIDGQEKRERFIMNAVRKNDGFVQEREKSYQESHAATDQEVNGTVEEQGARENKHIKSKQPDAINEEVFSRMESHPVGNSEDISGGNDPARCTLDEKCKKHNGLASKDNHKIKHRIFTFNQRDHAMQELLTSKVKAHAQKEIIAIKEKGHAKREGILSGRKDFRERVNDGQGIANQGLAIASENWDMKAETPPRECSKPGTLPKIKENEAPETVVKQETPANQGSQESRYTAPFAKKEDAGNVVLHGKKNTINDQQGLLQTGNLHIQKPSHVIKETYSKQDLKQKHDTCISEKKQEPANKEVHENRIGDKQELLSVDSGKAETVPVNSQAEVTPAGKQKDNISKKVLSYGEKGHTLNKNASLGGIPKATLEFPARTTEESDIPHKDRLTNNNQEGLQYKNKEHIQNEATITDKYYPSDQGKFPSEKENPAKVCTLPNIGSTNEKPHKGLLKERESVNEGDRMELGTKEECSTVVAASMQKVQDGKEDKRTAAPMRNVQAKKEDKSTETPMRNVQAKNEDKSIGTPMRNVQAKNEDKSTGTPLSNVQAKNEDKSIGTPMRNVQAKNKDKSTGTPMSNVQDINEDKSMGTPIKNVQDKKDDMSSGTPMRNVQDKKDDMSSETPMRNVQDKKDDMSSGTPMRNVQDKKDDKSTGTPMKNVQDKQDNKSMGTSMRNVQDKKDNKSTGTPIKNVQDKKDDKSIGTPMRNVQDKKDDKSIGTPMRNVQDKKDDMSSETPMRNVQDKKDDMSSETPMRNVQDKKDDMSSETPMRNVQDKKDDKSTGTPMRNVQDKKDDMSSGTPMKNVQSRKEVLGTIENEFVRINVFAITRKVDTEWEDSSSERNDDNAICEIKEMEQIKEEAVTYTAGSENASAITNQTVKTAGEGKGRVKQELPTKQNCPTSEAITEEEFSKPDIKRPMEHDIQGRNATKEITKPVVLKATELSKIIPLVKHEHTFPVTQAKKGITNEGEPASKNHNEEVLTAREHNKAAIQCKVPAMLSTVSPTSADHTQLETLGKEDSPARKDLQRQKFPKVPTTVEGLEDSMYATSKHDKQKVFEEQPAEPEIIRTTKYSKPLKLPTTENSKIDTDRIKLNISPEVIAKKEDPERNLCYTHNDSTEIQTFATKDHMNVLMSAAEDHKSDGHISAEDSGRKSPKSDVYEMQLTKSGSQGHITTYDSKQPAPTNIQEHSKSGAHVETKITQPGVRVKPEDSKPSELPTSEHPKPEVHAKEDTAVFTEHITSAAHLMREHYKHVKPEDSKPVTMEHPKPDVGLKPGNIKPGKPVPNEHPKPGVGVKPENITPGIPVPNEHPKPGVGVKPENIKPGIPVPNEHPKPGVGVKPENIKPGIPVPNEHPKPGVGVKPENITPGIPVPNEHPKPGVGVKPENIKPGIPVPNEHPKPGVRLKSEYSKPGVLVTTDHPKPDVAVRTEHPKPVLRVKSEYSKTGIQVTTEYPKPGVPRTAEHQKPDIHIKSEDNKPGLPVTTEPNKYVKPGDSRPNVSIAGELPKPSVPKRTQHPKLVTKEHTKPDRPVTTEHSKPGAPIRRQHPNLDIPVKTEHHKTGDPIRTEHLKLDIPVTTEHPTPGLCIKSDHSKAGLSVMTEHPKPSVDLTEEHPKPGVHLTAEHPKPGVHLTAEHPKPGVHLTAEHPKPGVHLTAEHPKPGVPVTTQHYKLDAPVTIEHLTSRAKSEDSKSCVPVTTEHFNPVTHITAEPYVPITTEHLKPDMHVTTEDSKLGLPVRAKHPKLVVPKTTEHPKPDVPLTKEHPTPNVPVTIEHLKPGLHVKSKHGKTVVAVTKDHPKPDQSVTKDHSKPGAAVTTDHLKSVLRIKSEGSKPSIPVAAELFKSGVHVTREDSKAGVPVITEHPKPVVCVKQEYSKPHEPVTTDLNPGASKEHTKKGIPVKTEHTTPTLEYTKPVVPLLKEEAFTNEHPKAPLRKERNKPNVHVRKEQHELEPLCQESGNLEMLAKLKGFTSDRVLINNCTTEPAKSEVHATKDGAETKPKDFSNLGNSHLEMKNDPALVPKEKSQISKHTFPSKEYTKTKVGMLTEKEDINKVRDIHTWMERDQVISMKELEAKDDFTGRQGNSVSDKHPIYAETPKKALHESYLSVQEAQQILEQELKVRNSPGNTGIIQQRESKEEGLPYYAITNHDTEVEAKGTLYNSSQKTEMARRTREMENSGKVVDDGRWTHNTTDPAEAHVLSPRPDTSSPSLGKPILFKVKDNTFKTSPVTKTVKPYFHKTFPEDLQLSSPISSEKGEDWHDAVSEDTKVVQHAAGLSNRFQQPKERSPRKALFPSDSTATREPHGYSKKNLALEEDECCSIGSALSEESCAAGTADVTNDRAGILGVTEVAEVLRSISERPEPTCSGNEGKTFGKPPVVPPKTEKALRRAQKLTTRRIKKADAKVRPDGTWHLDQTSLRMVSSEPPSPTGQLLSQPLALNPNAASHYCMEPGCVPSAPKFVAQPFPLTERKLLQDPNSGQYFMVEMPVPVKTKTFFDPETGKYIQLSVRQSPEGTLSPASSVELMSPPYLLYPGFLTLPVASVPPLRSSSQMSAPAALADDQEMLELNDPWVQKGYCPEFGQDSQMYIEPVYMQHEQPQEPRHTESKSSQRKLNIISMSELEDFAVEST